MIWFRSSAVCLFGCLVFCGFVRLAGFGGFNVCFLLGLVVFMFVGLLAVCLGFS